MKHNARRRVRPDRLGDYEVQTSMEGFSSIRQISSGEVMHSVNCPNEEANKLYVEQSCLASRLAAPAASGDDALVIWDVGLGAATNAMAALHCFERQWNEGKRVARPLYMVSFESDLDSLRLATMNPKKFPHLRHPAPHKILNRGLWNHESGLLRWELLKGNFMETLVTAERPDLIFYDPFSFKTDSGLWTAAAFSLVFAKCREKSAELYTYSASTAVRAALLASGFIVAEGVGTGPKSTTTIAFTRREGAAEHPLTPHLLGPDWLTRWKRSDSKLPPGVTSERIEGHPQFCSGGL